MPRPPSRRPATSPPDSSTSNLLQLFQQVIVPTQNDILIELRILNFQLEQMQLGRSLPGEFDSIRQELRAYRHPFKEVV